jgi:hypothetical protein
MISFNASKVIGWFIIAGLVLLIGLGVFPTVHIFSANTDTTGFSDLLKFILKLWPIGFLVVVVYGILKMRNN